MAAGDVRAGRAYIEVTVDDKATAQARVLGQRVQGELNKGGDMIGRLFNVAAMVNATKAVLVLGNAFQQLAQGDIKGVDEALKKLPLGFGQVYTAARDFFSLLVTGKTATEQYAEAARNAAEANQRWQKTFKAMDDYRRARATEGLSGDALRKKELEMNAQEAIDEIDRDINALLETARKEAAKRNSEDKNSWILAGLFGGVAGLASKDADNAKVRAKLEQQYAGMSREEQMAMFLTPEQRDSFAMRQNAIRQTLAIELRKISSKRPADSSNENASRLSELQEEQQADLEAYLEARELATQQHEQRLARARAVERYGEHALEMQLFDLRAKRQDELNSNIFGPKVRQLILDRYDLEERQVRMLIAAREREEIRELTAKNRKMAARMDKVRLLMDRASAEATYYQSSGSLSAGDAAGLTIGGESQAQLARENNDYLKRIAGIIESAYNGAN